MQIALMLVAVASPIVNISPWFSPKQGGPAFLVECRNAGARPIGGDSLVDGTLRLDGRVDSPSGIAGSMLGGAPPPVAPNATWRAIVVLDQTELSAGTSTPPAGTDVRWARFIPVADGRHRVAFRCGQIWSKDVEFYWEKPK